MSNRQTREHPPVNGCTLRGQHACILTTGQPVPTVLAAAIDRNATSPHVGLSGRQREAYRPCYLGPQGWRHEPGCPEYPDGQLTL